MNKLRVGLIVDDSFQSYLTHDLYLRSLMSNKYSIEYLIVQKLSHNKNKSFIKYFFNFLKIHGLKRFIDKIAFAIIDRFENIFVLRNIKFKKVLAKHSLTEFNVSKLYVNPLVSATSFVFSYSKEDIVKIESLKLDVLIRCGTGILRGEILKICRFGILSFHHANNDINRGIPPGFWEVFNREPSTGFVIQKLLPELDGGDVIFKGSIATSFLYKINLCKLLIKSAEFLHLILERLAHDPDSLKVYPKAPYAYPLYTTPTLSQLIWYVQKTFFYSITKIIRKILKKNFRWSVAYQSTDDWKNSSLWRSIVIKNPPFRYLADPFVITYNSKTVIYVEDYDYRSSRGKISAYEINGKNYKELGVILEEDFHLSFPFLLRIKEDIYMVPESHQNNDIRLYKCTNFPLKWELSKILIKGLSAVDTLVFEYDKKWWILTNKDSSQLGDHGSELHIYYSDSLNSENWTPHISNPVIFDSLCARNGGMIFSNNCIYRVFQKQGFDMYGESLGISKITELNTLNYKEEVLYDIPAKFMKNIKGTHTYSFDSSVLCFDFVRYEDYRK